MHFVLGGSGFLGSAITNQLKALGVPYVSINRSNYSEFVGQTCEVLINANGNSKKYLASANPIEDFELSVTSVRRSLADFKYSKYVYLSSGEVYPKIEGAETSESAEILVPQQTQYGFHKYLAELSVRHVATNWLIFRLGGFVGPGLKKNVVFDLLSNQPIWVSLESSFQFLETRSAAEIILSMSSASENKEVYNLAASGSMSVNDIAKLLGASPILKIGAQKEVHELDTSKLQKILRVPTTYESLKSFYADLGNEGAC